MGMAGQAKGKAELGGGFGHLGAVGKQDLAGVFGHVFLGGRKVMGAKKSRIVDPDQPEALVGGAGWDQGSRFIEQAAQSCAFQSGDDVQAVVISEDGKGGLGKVGQEFESGCQGRGGVAQFPLAEIAGDYGGLNGVLGIEVSRSGQSENDGGRQSVVEIEVEVGKLEQAEAVEGAGQGGEDPIVLLDAKI
jgi:hypothetical protein